MSIKTLLEKAMLRLGSRGGRNGNESVAITIDQSSVELQRFTAPADGTYEASSVATSDNGFQWMDDGSGNRWACRALFTNGAMSFSFPVKKGAIVYVQWGSAMKDRHLKFVKSIGGGA